MKKKVLWSARALADYENILEYIDETWSFKEVRKFDELMENAIYSITQNTEIGAVSKKKNVRRLVISKQTSIYYQVKKEVIYIITLSDNRQNPSKLKL